MTLSVKGNRVPVQRALKVNAHIRIQSTPVCFLSPRDQATDGLQDVPRPFEYELRAASWCPAAGCKVWLVEIREYYKVESSDMSPPHACFLKNTLQSSVVKASPHIPWTKSLQLVSVGKGDQLLGFCFPCHKHYFNYISCGQAVPRILTLNKHVNWGFTTNASRSILACFLAFKHRICSDNVSEFCSKSMKAWKV